VFRPTSDVEEGGFTGRGVIVLATQRCHLTAETFLYSYEIVPEKFDHMNQPKLNLGCLLKHKFSALTANINKNKNGSAE